MSGVSMTLQGHTALITGGSRGIGRAIAQRFLEAGAEVIIIARRPDVLEETRKELDKIAPGKLTTYACDVSQRDPLAAVCASIKSAGKAVDILVNNAGTANRGKFEENTDEYWQSDFDLKLFAAIRLTRFVLPTMKEKRWGRILNIVSTQGKTPGAGGAPTAVSRAAGIAMSKIMASEFGPHNILVNALCTGAIMSDQIGFQAAAKKVSIEQHIAERSKTIPLGRIGEAEEYANVALFLASDLGAYVTGAAINIDGGNSPAS